MPVLHTTSIMCSDARHVSVVCDVQLRAQAAAALRASVRRSPSGPTGNAKTADTKSMPTLAEVEAAVLEVQPSLAAIGQSQALTPCIMMVRHCIHCTSSDQIQL